MEKSQNDILTLDAISLLCFSMEISETQECVHTQPELIVVRLAQ